MVVPPFGHRHALHSDRLRHVRVRSIERGVLLRPLGNVVYAIPPACVSDEECDRIAEAVLGVLDGPD